MIWLSNIGVKSKRPRFNSLYQHLRYILHIVKEEWYRQMVPTMKPPLKPRTDNRRLFTATWEASPKSAQSVIQTVIPLSIRPSSVRSVTPSLYWESDTAAWGRGGGGGRLEGRFFFSSCIWCGEWRVESGLSMQVLFGRGQEDLFSFQPMGRPKVPCFYSF